VALARIVALQIGKCTSRSTPGLYELENQYGFHCRELQNQLFSFVQTISCCLHILNMVFNIHLIVCLLRSYIPK